MMSILKAIRLPILIIGHILRYEGKHSWFKDNENNGAIHTVHTMEIKEIVQCE
jgi:hypothetical protein